MAQMHGNEWHTTESGKDKHTLANYYVRRDIQKHMQRGGTLRSSTLSRMAAYHVKRLSAFKVPTAGPAVPTQSFASKSMGSGSFWHTPQDATLHRTSGVSKEPAAAPELVSETTMQVPKEKKKRRNWTDGVCAVEPNPPLPCPLPQGSQQFLELLTPPAQEGNGNIMYNYGGAPDKPAISTKQKRSRLRL